MREGWHHGYFINAELGALFNLVRPSAQIGKPA